MNYDKDKVDEMALALLYLSTFEEQHGYKRAWKGIAWEITNRLYDKGFISDPKNKNQSLILNKEGAKRSEELFLKHFSANSHES